MLGNMVRFMFRRNNQIQSEFSVTLKFDRLEFHEDLWIGSSNRKWEINSVTRERSCSTALLCFLNVNWNSFKNVPLDWSHMATYPHLYKRYIIMITIDCYQLPQSIKMWTCQRWLGRKILHFNLEYIILRSEISNTT